MSFSIYLTNVILAHRLFIIEKLNNVEKDGAGR